MIKKLPTIEEQVKSIATKAGIDEEKALEIAKKCEDELMWHPYGGAKSFAEIDAMESARNYAYKIDDETYKLRGIIENITMSDDMETSDKVSAIQSAAGEFGSRIENIDASDSKSFWDNVKEFFLGNKVIKKEGDNWVVYSKGGRKLGTHKTRKSAVQQLQAIEANKEVEEEDLTGRSFKIFRDKTTGEYRWLAFSSNAFEDREKELFSTEALEEAVAYAEKSDERGPLMVYHIPGTEIGQCDFQAVQGRFLIESGTFDDTPLGNKALEYLMSNEDSFQVSIGYKYIEGDEKDGTYDWLRFRERSICPEGTAANPWTEFQIFGGKEMDDQHKATLTKIFGEELANDVISKADSKTKELEDGNVRFKADPKTSDGEVDGEAFIKQLAKNLGIDESKVLEEAKKIAASVSEDGKSEEKEESKEDPEPAPAFDNAKLTEMAQLIANMAEQVDTLTTTVKEMKEAKGEDWTPRINMKALVPTEDSKNIIDDAKAKEITNNEEDGNKNPAFAYVQDLIQAGGRVPANN